MQFKYNPTETENKTKQQTTVLHEDWLILVTICHQYLKVGSLRYMQMSKVISTLSSNHIWNLSMAVAGLTLLCPLQE